MKNITIKKIILTAAILFLMTIACVVGYEVGKAHVIYTQELWVLDFDQPDDQHDITIYADIDGAWHEYGGYIG